MTSQSGWRLDVRFYRGSNSREPVRDWLKSLSAEDRKGIGIDILEVQKGWPLGMPLVRKMEPGLWEVRVTLKERTARVLFTVTGTTMVLVHAFIKKSQSMPGADMEIARRRMKEVGNG